MKVCLIKAPDIDVKDPCMDPPLNLLYIASALLQKGFEVQIIDCGSDMPASFPPADLYGITCVTPNLKEAYRTAARLKKQYTDCRFILGGSHANVLPQSINTTFFDAIVTGECEENIAELMQNGQGICQGIPPQNIDSLHPLPWHLLSMDKYLGQRGISPRNGTLLLSRGCPYRCTFCLNGNPCFKQRYRCIASETLQREIEVLKNDYHIDSFLIVDDYLDFKQYSEVLACSGLPWWCLATIRQMITSAKEFKSAGCVGVRLGVESGSEKMLKIMKKPQNLSQILFGISKAKEAGLQVHAFIFIGFPGETWDTIYETEKLIKELDIDAVRFNIFVPYPGTLPFHYPQKFGITWLSPEWSDFRAKNKYSDRVPCFETAILSCETLVEMAEYLTNIIKSKGYEIF